MVAESGVLISQVTQIKHKQKKCFVSVNVGMNSLLRPALYGSYHHIRNLSAYQRENTKTIVADIVGPICESGDVLGYERIIDEPQVGDLFIRENTGAYGRVMSSNYNSKPPAKEIILS